MKSFFVWFSTLFSGIGAYYRKIMIKVKPFMEKQIPVAVGFVNVVKMVVENPALDFLTALSASGLDDMLLKQARNILPDLAIKLRLLEISTVVGKSNQEIVDALIAFLASLDPMDRFGKYKELANHITYSFADGKISWTEIDTAVELIHRKKIDGVEAKLIPLVKAAA